jgi:hypothetical protein
MHATGSKAFTETVRRVAGKGNTDVKNLFLRFTSFIAANPDDLDVLTSDEAHRIRATSVNRSTPARLRSEQGHIDEPLDAARVAVFLLDRHQVVRPGEIGSTEAVKKAAKDRGIPVERVELDTRFRSGGSRAHEHWVRHLIDLEPGGLVLWEGDDNVELHVADGPEELERELTPQQESGFSARKTAGFCWPCSKPEDGALVDDLVVGAVEEAVEQPRRASARRHPRAEPWASEPGGFGQVGCVYTAPGFECDWNGVILGPDLVWRGDHVVSDVHESKDSVFRGKAGVEFDSYVRNNYKVLLTRGMRGTSSARLTERSRRCSRAS